MNTATAVRATATFKYPLRTVVYCAGVRAQVIQHITPLPWDSESLYRLQWMSEGKPAYQIVRESEITAHEGVLA